MRSHAFPASELEQPAPGYWRETGSMLAPHSVHTATLLPNGQVLVAGGAFVSANCTIR